MNEGAAHEPLADLERPLEALRGIRGVLGGLVATEDGLTLAARLNGGLDAEAHAAAAAALCRLGGKTLAAMNRGELQMVAVEASKITLVASALPIGYLLVLSEPKAELAPVVAEMRGAARALAKAAASLMAEA